MNKIAFIFGIRTRSGTNFLNQLVLMHPNCHPANASPENYLLAYSDHLIEYTNSTLLRWHDDWFGKHLQQPEREKSKLLTALGNGICNNITGNDEKLTYVTKTPSPEGINNFFHLFPEQKLILLVRNGKDQVESAMRSFQENRPDYDYCQAMQEYAKNAQIILDFLEQWRSKQDQFLLVYYENLVRYTKSEADRIFTFLDIDPNSVTEKQLQSLPIMGSSTNRGGEDQVHWTPVYDKSNFNPLARSQDWSEELHQQFADICGEVSRNLGYDLQTNLPIETPDYSLTDSTNQSSPQNQLPEENITHQLSPTKIALEITREFLRKLWFTMGENKNTQFIYRRLLESATTVKADIIGPRMNYYNETRNDRWIIEYIFPGKYNGYFVEAGAANGKNASSCYLLETEYDWRGICIEPHEDFFTQLLQNRLSSICENICLAEKEGEVIYIKGEANQSDAYLSGIKSNLEQFKYKGEEMVARGEAISKQATTLEALLDKHKAPKIIDYGAFDIEGSELKVLEVFPFDKYTFLALTLECDSKIRKPITQLLKSKGYREVKNPFNRNKPWERYWLHFSCLI